MSKKGYKIFRSDWTCYPDYKRQYACPGEFSVDDGKIFDADEHPSAIVQRDEEFAEVKNVITVNADTGEVVNAEEVHDEQPQQAQKFSLS